MGFWMLMGWGVGVAVLVLLVLAVTRAAGGHLGAQKTRRSRY
jgi:hypothetical protein